jgi:exopolysaccharide biosynthesis polyprenyl glycosylphosphotransferase
MTEPTGKTLPAPPSMALADAVRPSRHDLHDLLDDRSREIIERRNRSRIKRRGWLIRRALLVGDVIGLTVAFLVAELGLGRNGGDTHAFGDATEFALFVALVPLWILGAKLCGLYDRDEERTDYSTTDDLVGVFVLVTLLTWLFTLGALVIGYNRPNQLRLALFWAAAIPAIAIGRSIVRTLCRRHVAYVQNTVIVGAGEVGQLIASKLLKHPEYGVNVVGFVDDEPMERRDDLDSLTLLGSLGHLPSIVQALDVERVIIAFSRYSDHEILDTVRALKDVNVQIDVVPRLFDVVNSPADVHTVEGLPLVGLPPPCLPRSSMLIKRSFDLVLSAMGLIVLAPLFLVVGVLIKLDSRGPIFFRQPRMGCNDRVFRIYKFRTMTTDAEERKPELAHLNRHAQHGGDPRMTKIPNDPRVTRVGKVLRRFSLDEFPQLINVLTGEMSLVGPRPLILDEDQHVKDWARRRILIRPGITGLWQVLGSSSIPFDEMVKLDYRYVTRWSLFLDLKLILRTIPAVLRPRTAD